MHLQRTLRDRTGCHGVGLHSGRRIELALLPAPVDSGITFVRSDLPCHPELRPCLEHLADTTLATTLSVGQGAQCATVGTVEHLLAAFTGLGIDNARVLVDGPEVPILDGSAAPFVEMIDAVGIQVQPRTRRTLVIRREVRVADGDKLARIVPGAGLSITLSLDFDHPLISPAPVKFVHSEATFRRQLASARTFGFLHEVEALRARGLARGGSLDNAIVIDKYRILNPEGLRFPDECARHKVLDTLGDFSLFGAPVIGKVTLHRTGHALNARLVAAVLADPRAYTVLESRPAAAAERGAATPAFDLFDGLKGLA